MQIVEKPLKIISRGALLHLKQEGLHLLPQWKRGYKLKVCENVICFFYTFTTCLEKRVADQQTVLRDLISSYNKIIGKASKNYTTNKDASLELLKVSLNCYF